MVGFKNNPQVCFKEGSSKEPFFRCIDNGHDNIIFYSSKFIPSPGYFIYYVEIVVFIGKSILLHIWCWLEKVVLYINYVTLIGKNIILDMWCWQAKVFFLFTYVTSAVMPDNLTTLSIAHLNKFAISDQLIIHFWIYFITWLYTMWSNHQYIFWRVWQNRVRQMITS